MTSKSAGKDADSATVETAPATPPAPSTTDAAFEIVTLLPGLTRLVKRGGELDGNLPVRAARYCGPVFEGSAAGFQVVLEQPMTLARRRGGAIACDMTEPTLRLVTEQVDAALERGIREGLLARGGYWHKRLAGDAIPIRPGRVLVWTGHMIRPRAGTWLLVGGAFNRRSRVTVLDHVVADAGRFVPLVIEIDARALEREPAWLEGELGCVTPLAPRVRVRKQRLRPGDPELRQFAAFFSHAYFETKANHPTAAYVRARREHRVAVAPACEARLAFAGPDVHRVLELDRFIGPSGFSARAPSPGIVQYGVVGNIAATRWTWQGQTHSRFEVRKERHLPALRRLWNATFGAGGEPAALEFLSLYLAGEHWDQPYVQLQPWAFATTPSGWSTLVDGVHRPPSYDGMRGVIATDWFTSLAMVYRLYGPGSAVIPYRAPLLRALPVPRALLALGMKESSLAD